MIQLNSMKYIKTVFSFVAFFVFFGLVGRKFISEQLSKSDKPILWNETVGSLDPHGHSHGTIYYDVAGKLHTAVFWLRDDDNVLGEKYSMRYTANNPDEIEIDYWHPVFIEGEETIFFDAVITKVNKRSFINPTPFVIFDFKVYGRVMKKSVYLPENHKELYPELKEGNHYKVECWEKDIHRVVLHLDKLIEDKEQN